MHIVRTIIWVLLLTALLVFAVANWEPVVTLRIWPGLLVDTKIPLIVTVCFLIGFLPTWLFARAQKWQFKRRINSLENAARSAAITPAVSIADPAPTNEPSLTAEAEAPEPDRPPLA